MAPESSKNPFGFAVGSALKSESLNFIERMFDIVE